MSRTVLSFTPSEGKNPTSGQDLDIVGSYHEIFRRPREADGPYRDRINAYLSADHKGHMCRYDPITEGCKIERVSVGQDAQGYPIWEWVDTWDVGRASALYAVERKLRAALEEQQKMYAADPNCITGQEWALLETRIQGINESKQAIIAVMRRSS